MCNVRWVPGGSLCSYERKMAFHLDLLEQVSVLSTERVLPHKMASRPPESESQVVVKHQLDPLKQKILKTRNPHVS